MDLHRVQDCSKHYNKLVLMHKNTIHSDVAALDWVRLEKKNLAHC